MVMTKPKPLFDYRVDVAAKVRECLDSGVPLTNGEQHFLQSFQAFLRPTQSQYRTLWELCSKCGVK
jgi:hypothetical protein